MIPPKFENDADWIQERLLSLRRLMLTVGDERARDAIAELIKEAQQRLDQIRAADR